MMTPARYEACKRAIHVIMPDGRVLRAGRAAMELLKVMGLRTLGTIGSFPPMIWFIELGYWLIARNRSRVYRWFLKGFCRPVLETEYAKQAEAAMKELPPGD